MTTNERKIKNWEIPKGKKTALSFYPIQSGELSVRLRHCLTAMRISQLKDVCVPNVWYASTDSWTKIMHNQPNFGRKAYREFVEYLIKQGLEPIYVEDGDGSEDSMTGRLMK